MTENKTIVESHYHKSIQGITLTKPPFIVRNSLFLLIIILLVFVFITWIIKYPDIIKVNAKLISINAPKEIVSRISGKLIKLYVKEGTSVQKGDILGYLETTANCENVIFLSSIIDSIVNYPSLQSNSFLLKEGNLNLGELQSDFQSFINSFQQFKSYSANGFFLKRLNDLKKDLTLLQEINVNLLNQKEITKEDMSIQQKIYEANKSLHGDKVISDFEFGSETSKLLGKKILIPQVNLAIINNLVLQSGKRKEIAELENSILQQKIIFEQAIRTFKSKIDDWKKKYLLVSPINGKVAFLSFFQENQQIQPEQLICFVKPNDLSYFAEIVIPQENFGKVNIGQKVLLKFSAYPFQEFGILEGSITYISSMNTEGGYFAKVNLNNGLKTNFGKEIEYRYGLKASGEIITKDLRLVERFYYNIIKQLNLK